MVDRKNGIHPQDPEAAGANQGDHHRQDRAAQPPDDAGKNIHNGVQTVGRAYQPQADQAHRDHGGVVIVEGKQRLAEPVGQQTGQLPDQCPQQQAPQRDAPKAAELPRAEVLAGKGQGGLRHRVGAGENKAFDIGSGGVAGHDGAAEGIDRRLDKDVGNGEDGPLHPGGDADLQDADQLFPVQGKPFWVDMVAAVGVQHAPQHQSGRK